MMLEYLLKSGACLTILVLFYKLLLERESIHVFKRYYLLAALVLSFVIPLIVFTEYVEISTVSEVIATPATSVRSVAVDRVEPVGDLAPITPPLLLWTIYGLGMLLFGFKFLKNLGRIIQRIRKNPKFTVNSITKVLLNERIAPHTFFRYIFLNRENYEKKEIPQAVLLHEETHAKQKHSLDVLFIELLQVVFWFNPLIYFTKRYIKLNHEFLADQAVVDHGVETATYQNILLAFSSNAAVPQFSNSINYSSIKKRFTVMKKRTSKKAILLRSFLLLPLFSFLLYGFSETVIIQKEADLLEAKVPSKVVENRITVSPEQRYLALPFPEFDLKTEMIRIEIDKKGTIRSGGKSLTIESLPTFLKKYNAELSKEERESSVRAIIKVAENTPKSIVNQVERIIVAYGVAQINIEGPMPSSLPQEAASRKPMIQIEIDKKGAIRSGGKSLTIESLPTFLKKYNAELSKEEREKSVRAIIKVAENTPKSIVDQVERIMVAYGVAQINIEGPMPSSLSQDGATEDQIKEYDAIVKRINAQPENRRIYKKKEVERLEYIFGLMTEQQKKKAEPYPDFPPMPEPPAPPAPKEATPPSAIRAPKQPVGIRLRTAPVAPEAPEAPEVPKIEEPVLIHVEEIEEVEPPEAPEPPESPEPPMTPLDHVIEMAKADATFYYEGKKISSDMAIEMLKKNQNVDIDIGSKDGQRPVVKLSKDPFVIENR